MTKQTKDYLSFIRQIASEETTEEAGLNPSGWYEENHNRLVIEARRINDCIYEEKADTVCAQLRQVGDVAMTTGGLTKREWFAGMALQGLIINHVFDKVTADEIAKQSLQFADVMIKAGKETE